MRSELLSEEHVRQRNQVTFEVVNGNEMDEMDSFYDVQVHKLSDFPELMSFDVLVNTGQLMQ